MHRLRGWVVGGLWALAVCGATGQEIPVVRGAAHSVAVVPRLLDVDLRELPKQPAWRPGDPIRSVPRRHRFNPTAVSAPQPVQRDPLLEWQLAGENLRAPAQRDLALGLNFNGQAYSGVNPADPVGDVGQTYFIQAINSAGGTSYVVYRKSDGGIAAGPFTLAALGGTGLCATGYGDPIVLYDGLANRWLLSEFSGVGNALCVYISATPGDPIAGGWYAYTFATPDFPDYPKYAVWPNLYAVTSNESVPTLYALDRAKMLLGQAATMQRFTVTPLGGFSFQALTPVDLDGATPPPGGAPAYFIRHNDDEAHGPPSNPGSDFLELWNLSVDFTTPANTVLAGPISIPISNFDSDLNGLTSFQAFPQPGTAVRLDPLREIVMHRAVYRNFGTHEVLLGSFVTDVSGADHGGVRWFELRKSGGNPWALYQEGTYAPDAHNRWMSSIAMDGSGNIAIGYNIVSASVYPGLRAAGRLAGDPLGSLPQPERTIVNGSAANNSNRYGDYNALTVDPVDDCTFWFTGMYNASGTWSTRIATFSFDTCGCVAGPGPGSLNAQPDGDNRILVRWPAKAGAATYTLLRRTGSCGGTYLPLIAGLTATSHVDTAVSGGSQYAYVVRAVDASACVSSNSPCASATATGICAEPPTFAGLQSVAPLVSQICTLELRWNAATPACGSAVTYNVYRSTNPAFVPAPANRIATCLTGTNYLDLTVGADITYTYVVRAEDNEPGGAGPCGGNEDLNTVRRAGAAAGASAPLFADDFESGAGKWTFQALPSDPGSVAWTLTTSAAASPTHAYFCVGQPSIKDQTIRLKDSVAIPAGVAATLRFNHRYGLENGFDGGVLEYSVNGGANWHDIRSGDGAGIPATNRFVSGGYTDTISTGYSSPIGGRLAWTGDVTSFSPVVVTLQDFANRSLLLRWRMACDTSVASTGWWVDDVVISYPASCQDASIRGRVTRSDNAQGRSDVSLLFSNGGGTALTDGAGNYVHLVPDGWSGTATPVYAVGVFTPTSRNYANVTAPVLAQDYVWTPPVVSIAGRITRTGTTNGVAGVTVTFSNGGGSTQTDAGGNYTRVVPYEWSGIATPSFASGTFAPSNRVHAAVTASLTGQDFVWTPPIVSVAGRVTRTDNAQGLPGVTVTFSNGGGSTQTDTNGNYTLNVPYAWAGTATPSFAAGTFAPPNRVYGAVTANQTAQDYAWTPPVVSIAGRVTRTGTTNGVAGVTVTFSNGGGSTQTDAGGNYTRVVPYEWAGAATPSFPSGAFAPSSRVHAAVTASLTGQDFVWTPPIVSVAGRVTRSDNAQGLSGVVLIFSNGGGNTQTDANGNYTHNVPYGWSGTVTPSFASGTFNPSNRTYAAITLNQTAQDFLWTPPPDGNIAGRVVRSDDGQGVVGVTLTFSNGGGNTQTDANGNYARAVPHGWSGTVTPSFAVGAFAPTSRTYVSVTTALVNQDYVWTPPIVSIAGRVTRADTAQGLAAATLTFSNSGGSTQTDANGDYSHAVPYGWAGNATPSYAAGTFAPTGRTYAAVTSNQSNQNYVWTPPVVGVAGRVTRADNAQGLANATLAFSNGGGSTQTDADGNYARTVPYEWAGTVTPSFPTGAFAPLSRTHNAVTVALVDQDFLWTPTDFGGALESPTLAWSTGGDVPWFRQTAITHDGQDAAQSGAIGNGQQSVLQTTITGPASLLFWWRVSSQQGQDILDVRVGDTVAGSLSGEVNWRRWRVYIPAGEQTVTWRYRKDGSGAAGLDAAWLDQVEVRMAATPGDFDNDGISDIGCYFPPGGDWFVYRSTLGFLQTQFGYAGTLPVPGDFDGDGRADLGCYFPPLGLWYLYRSTEGFLQTQFGFDGTLPVTGDFDGDGRSDFGVYYPPAGSWYLFRSSLGSFQTQFGFAGTLPVVGDFDGDGRADIGCYYPPLGMWYLFQSTEGFRQTQFGYAGTTPVVGDFDGDGRDDIGCHDAQTGQWYFFRSTDGFTQLQRQAGGIPFTGYFRTTDRRAAPGLYVPATGAWSIFHWDGQTTTTSFGFNGTLPILK